MKSGNTVDIWIFKVQFLRISGLLPIKFSCDILPHMNIGVSVIVAIAFQKVDDTSDAKAGTKCNYQRLKNAVHFPP